VLGVTILMTQANYYAPYQFPFDFRMSANLNDYSMVLPILFSMGFAGFSVLWGSSVPCHSIIHKENGYYYHSREQCTLVRGGSEGFCTEWEKESKKNPFNLVKIERAKLEDKS
jgi:hypothetical protein